MTATERLEQIRSSLPAEVQELLRLIDLDMETGPQTTPRWMLHQAMERASAATTANNDEDRQRLALAAASAALVAALMVGQ